MQKEGNILIIDDDEDILSSSRMILKKHFAAVHTLPDPGKIPHVIKDIPYDVIMLDLNFSPGSKSGKEGIKWLGYIKENSPVSLVVIITAYGDVNLAVDCMKKGAVDFVVKPWNSEKLLATVNTAYQLSRSRDKVEPSSTEQEQFHSDKLLADTIIGQSLAIKKVLDVVNKIAATDVNVLLTGENGTGKELVAREIHNLSARKDKPFISIDLGAVPGSLFEAELFGYKKGAFTDAKEDKPGRFEMANNGTLFLDEIGNLSYPMQAKLLRALQEKKISRLGSTNEITLNIRLISATNSSIKKLIHENKFREDLFYRINTVEIHIPPLRDRDKDIVLLAKYFVEHYAKKYSKPGMSLDKSAENKLKSYKWPGNVRELQHMMERAVIMNQENELSAKDFHIELPEAELSVGNTLNIEVLEKTAIEKAIRKHYGNLTHAAKELGLGRTTLYRKMEKYKIQG